MPLTIGTGPFLTYKDIVIIIHRRSEINQPLLLTVVCCRGYSKQLDTMWMLQQSTAQKVNNHSISITEKLHVPIHGSPHSRTTRVFTFTLTWMIVS